MQMPAVCFDIKDPGLADVGLRRIDWALADMPVLRTLKGRFTADRPLAETAVAACLHVTPETANLVRVLVAGGATVALCASNPLSTQDDIAAALALHLGIPVFARRGASHDQYYAHIHAALEIRPQITIDDGADITIEIHKTRTDLLCDLLGGTEETTTGVNRLRVMTAENALHYPVIAVNNAHTKHLFDNRFGAGQSTIDGVLRATNMLMAGRVLTVCGYGWGGRGVAMRARGLGAMVMVAEIDPLRALEAAMDGYRVMPLLDATPESDVIITTTGNRHVVDKQHLSVMKDGCVLANAGHFDVEINIPALRALSRSFHRPRAGVEEFALFDGRRVRLLSEGRVVNLTAAEGNPSTVMDMAFANQALCAAHIRRNSNMLERKVHAVPKEIDREVARLKLDALGVRIDSLSAEQEQYLTSWREGT